MLAWTLEEPAVRQNVTSPDHSSRLVRTSRLGTALSKIATRQALPPAKPELPVPHFAATESLDDVWESEPVTTEEPLLDDSADSESDRRAHPRHDSECDIWISLRPPHLEPGTNGRIRGRVVDVSLGGFALRTMAPITPGHRIWMRISNRHFAQVIETDGTALRCTPQPSGDWHVVCRLSRRLTFEQVNFVGKQLFASTLV